MPILHAIVLGVVQGLTEFLPVSSSGHLLLVPWLFGWDDFDGDKSLEKTFDVALHLGTLVGAVAYFRKDLVRLAFKDRRLGWLLVLATVPAAAAGAMGQGWIDEHLGKIGYIAVALIVFGVVLWLADRRPEERPIESLRWRDAVAVGVGQALALEPGVSRSGATMTVARGLRLERDAAARLSFLMSIPIIAGALLVKGVDVVNDGVPAGMGGAFVAGIVASGITGYFAVWGLLRLIRTTGFGPYVVYRVVLGVVVLIVLGVRA